MENFQFIRLDTKPSAQICYRFIDSSFSSKAKPHLLVFLNGLGLPQASWTPTILKLKALRGAGLPPILTYDRFGQGLTIDRDPNDESAADLSHGHDCLQAVRDLHQLVAQITKVHLGIQNLDEVSLIFVTNSIGGALSRLYAQEYPGTVSGLLLLDSVLANSDFVSIFPDPDEKSFISSALPDGVTPDGLREAREVVRKIFHPDNGSREGLSRRNLATLLPESNAPVLSGPGGHGPFVTVVGHDFETFAEESERMRIPKALTSAYVNPYWQLYNEGLVKITTCDRSKGPLHAPSSGHFIQKDNPDFVAEELNELIVKIFRSAEL